MVTTRFVSSLVIAAVIAVTASAQQVELLDFYLPTCGPCKAMAPTVSRLEAEGVRVRRVDGSREPQLVQSLRVDSYPTFVAVVDGREAGRVVGATSYDALRRLVAEAAPSEPKRAVAHTFAPTAGRENTFAAVGGDWGAGQPAPTRPAAQAAAPAPVGAHGKLLASSVRLTLVDPSGRSYGTGTIVDARSGEALIVTCAHLFRGDDGQPIDPSGQLTIELFDTATGVLRVAERVEGQLVSHDFEADVALVAIRPSGVVPTSPVASSPGDVRIGAPARSVGCDLGADPTVRESRIVDLNRYDGPPNIEAEGAPIQGRSGGGLFDDAGRLVGVCNFADDAAGEGIYAGLASIHAQLDRVGLTDLYRGTPAASPAFAAATPAFASASLPAATPPVAAAAPGGLTPVERTPIVRGQNALGASAAPLATTPLTTNEQATFGEIVSRGQRSEVVVLIRPDTPGGRTEVLTLDTASPEFVSALRRLGKSR